MKNIKFVVKVSRGDIHHQVHSNFAVHPRVGLRHNHRLSVSPMCPHRRPHPRRQAWLGRANRDPSMKSECRGHMSVIDQIGWAELGKLK